MQAVNLGRSGLVVSRIGLGLAALGRPGYINLGHGQDLETGRDAATMEAQAHQVLDEAWASGVRYFDAARSYGRAEAFLAGWLAARQITPEAVVIGSKWGYTYTADWQVEADHHEIKSHSLSDLQRQTAETFAVLGKQLDLYQIHSATIESGVLDDRDVLAELARMRAEGLRVGLSVSGPRQAETIRKAIAVRVDGQPVFDTVQATWNLLERSAGSALEEAHAAGVGVIIKEALANGRLTARNQDPAFASQRALMDAASARLHTTPDALAMAVVLAQPWVGVVLSGAGTVEQLRSNLAAANLVLDPATLLSLDTLQEGAETYWSTRSKLPWN